MIIANKIVEFSYFRLVFFNSSNMPQRQGVRTNATIRRNEFEHNANRGDFIMDKNNKVPFSLSKSKRWELLDDEEK